MIRCARARGIRASEAAAACLRSVGALTASALVRLPQIPRYDVTRGGIALPLAGGRDWGVLLDDGRYVQSVLAPALYVPPRQPVGGQLAVVANPFAAVALSAAGVRSVAATDDYAGTISIGFDPDGGAYLTDDFRALVDRSNQIVLVTPAHAIHRFDRLKIALQEAGRAQREIQLPAGTSTQEIVHRIQSPTAS
jgi:hypothetical protein